MKTRSAVPCPGELPDILFLEAIPTLSARFALDVSLVISHASVIHLQAWNVSLMSRTKLPCYDSFELIDSLLQPSYIYSLNLFLY